MKNLYESLLNDFDELTSNSDPRKEVEQFIEQCLSHELNKIKISRKPNKDGYYEVSSKGNVTFYNRVNAPKLTNGLFIWTQIKGDFDCSYNNLLETLEGGPYEVGGDFHCGHCEKLTSLEGAPKIIGGHFESDWCKNLSSLKGAPELIPGDFDCSYCESLKTLKDGPKEVKGTYCCAICGKTFTKSEIFKNTKVGGNTLV